MKRINYCDGDDADDHRYQPPTVIQVTQPLVINVLEYSRHSKINVNAFVLNTHTQTGYMVGQTLKKHAG